MVLSSDKDGEVICEIDGLVPGGGAVWGAGEGAAWGAV